MTDHKNSAISKRKSDHIDVVLTKEVGFGRLSGGFDAVQLLHNALPEIDLSSVDLSASLFGRSMTSPLLISSMTGGPDRASTINRNLAEAARELGIAFAVGSQRIALEEQGAGGFTKELRELAGNAPLIGNLGAAQILGPSGLSQVRRAIDMIEADGIFVHLNPLQEAVQSGGDTDWRGIAKAIGVLVNAGLPVAVKEVGFGLSKDVVSRLVDLGVQVIDVAGAGGTNWARVEGARGTLRDAVLASAFTEWGVPTAKAIAEGRMAAPDATLIASGGIRNGVDAAKAIALGADIVGQAAASLPGATTSTESVIDHFQMMIDTLRIACFSTGAKNISDLKKVETFAR